MTESLENLVENINKLSTVERDFLANHLSVKLESKTLNSKLDGLNDVINLVDEWLAEDDNYDQEVYSELETDLSNNRISIQANLLND